MKIVTYPNPILKAKSKPVEFLELRFGLDDAKKLVEGMQAAMYDQRGAGLAAVQVGVLKRLFILDVCYAGGLEVYINPEIIEKHGEEDFVDEGCLSLPGLFERVKRFPHVTVRALDLTGQEFVLDTRTSLGSEEKQKLRAQVIQHEIEHFEGVLMLDHLPEEERGKALKILKEHSK